MSSNIPTIEELQKQLETARQNAEATDAAILQAGSEIDEEMLSDLEARYNEETAEVERVTAAINRRVRLDDAIKAVPRSQDDDNTKPKGRIQVREPLTYRPVSEGGQHSFFKDVLNARSGNPSAASRLQRHEREMMVEFRNDMTTTDGAGGEFVPPLHLQQEWAELARAGRVFANAIGSRPIPSSGVSFTVPKVTGGTSTAVHTEGGAVSETDATTSEITLTVRTIAGQVDLSRQSFERSDPGLDQVLGADLAADYAVRVDSHILNHATDGILNNANINTVTYTDADPTVGELYPKLADAIQQIHTNRFMSPDAVFLHPRRWAWILSALDTTNRPLVTPYAPQNAVAGFGGVRAEGAVGNIQGLDVFVDANIPTTDGAGTNEDAIIVTRLADNMFFESPVPRVRVFEETLSGTLQVRLQVYGYLAYSSDRYGKAHSKITGTGLVAPTF